MLSIATTYLLILLQKIIILNHKLKLVFAYWSIFMYNLELWYTKSGRIQYSGVPRKAQIVQFWNRPSYRPVGAATVGTESSVPLFSLKK